MIWLILELHSLNVQHSATNFYTMQMQTRTHAEPTHGNCHFRESVIEKWYYYMHFHSNSHLNARGHNFQVWKTHSKSNKISWIHSFFSQFNRYSEVSSEVQPNISMNNHVWQKNMIEHSKLNAHFTSIWPPVKSVEFPNKQRKLAVPFKLLNARNLEKKTAQKL